MIISTNPSESILLMTLVWSTIAVMGSVLLPGAMVMFKIVEFPTIPSVAVARERVTLPWAIVSIFWRRESESHTMATVMRDGLGMYAKPLRLGSPAAAVRLTFTPVTLKPAKPLSADIISNYHFHLSK